jgi:hypothetical protein
MSSHSAISENTALWRIAMPEEDPSTASLENIRKSGGFKHLNVSNMEK